MPSPVDRLNHVDALKGAAILLVVAGHFLELFPADPVASTVYTAVYSFHMPLFVMLCGLFARDSLTAKQSEAVIERVVIPLLIFWPPYYYLGRWATGEDAYSWTMPYWHLWFLASLACWRMLLPLFRSPAGLAISVALALAAGLSSDISMALSLSRTVYFLPFFVFGSLYGRQILSWVADHRKLGIAFVVLMAVTVLWHLNGLEGTSLRGSFDYAAVSVFTDHPMLGRALVMLLGLCGALTFPALVPEKNRALEYLGRRSLGIYLLHGALVLAGRRMPMPQDGGWWLVPAVLAVSVATAFALAPLTPMVAALSGMVADRVSRFNSWVGHALRLSRIRARRARPDAQGRVTRPQA
ncbi:MAG: acyltransferase family protein [Methylobacterium mesophilicum]|nr:acyltransferase family protein [Methylobacterium mesophilicum]